MTGTALVPQPTQGEIAALARRYRAAGGVGMALLNVIGGQAENLLERLPDGIKDRLEGATTRALETASNVAASSRGVVKDQRSWLNTALTTAMGAAGGAGGLPSALAELPVTTTVLLRAIQGIAAEHGFDPNDPQIRRECLAGLWQCRAARQGRRGGYGVLVGAGDADRGDAAWGDFESRPPVCDGAGAEAGVAGGAGAWRGGGGGDELCLYQLLSGNGACALWADEAGARHRARPRGVAPRACG